jgi:hypothetical protein
MTGFRPAPRIGHPHHKSLFFAELTDVAQPAAPGGAASGRAAVVRRPVHSRLVALPCRAVTSSSKPGPGVLGAGCWRHGWLRPTRLGGQVQGLRKLRGSS